LVVREERQTPVLELGGTTLGGRESDGGASNGSVQSSLSIDEVDSFVVDVDVDCGVGARGVDVDARGAARGAAGGGGSNAVRTVA
jgi:hypothetical protein